MMIETMLGKILAGGVLIWLLITMFGSGAIFGIISNPAIIGFVLVVFIVWLFSKG